mmetsp:Transcript_77493/g.250835  ORF Transcript_77493/g.250835 Transcript_77493/m.250835 type:complete len:196 (-) Transcript_77493:299-886(-)
MCIRRGTRQQYKILRGIKKSLVNKCLVSHADIAAEKGDYEKLCVRFLKLGIHDDSANRIKMAKLPRRGTSQSGDEQIIAYTLVSLDKIRCESIIDPERVEDLPNPFIKIIPDKTHLAIIAEGCGIGKMNNAFFINWGTIAKSGTKALKEDMSAGGGISMFGQCGGFSLKRFGADAALANTVQSRRATFTPSGISV